MDVRWAHVKERPVRAPLPLWLALGLLFLTPGCDDRAASALPLWTPADHDNVASPAAGQIDTEAPRPKMPDLSQHGIDDVVLATWKQNCTSCHGLIGRGDGPQSPMFRPPDLTQPELQEGASDDEILSAIAKGRGKMPAFGHLPEDTRKGLLRLVRMLGAPRPSATSAAPEAAAPPPGHPPVGAKPPNHP